MDNRMDNRMDKLQLLETDPNEWNELEITENDLKICLEHLQKQFATPNPDDLPVVHASKCFDVHDKYTAVPCELVPYGKNGLEMTYKKKEFALCRLKYHFVRLGLMDLDYSTLQDTTVQYKSTFVKIHECMRRLYECLMCDLLTRRALDPNWASECPNQGDPFGLAPYDENKLSNLQSFIVFILDQLLKLGYKRYQDWCYKEIETPPVDGIVYKSKAWQRACSIEEFVLQAAPKETNFLQWQNMLSGSNKRATIEYLCTCRELQFPDLVPDKHYMSFQNGIYCTLGAKFLPWGSSDINASVTSCKYFDVPFPTEILDSEGDFQSIETPNFHRILTAQLLSEETIQWIYVFLGRLLFDVNQLDSWQVIPVFIGRAGTGKSLLLKAVGWFFREEDVGTISNNIQKGFGLEAFENKFMWRCLEVKNDFQLDQAQLQSMVTGEEMSIQRKNKIALNVIWKTPGILAGNELANWADNSGSISRRLILVYFNHTVNNSDPHLDSKIKQELPYLLHKCCVAYQCAVEAYGMHDIWTKTPELQILPSYFHEQREKLKSETHPLYSLLRNEELFVKVSKDAGGMPFKDFQNIANEYCRKNGLALFSWTKENKYKSTFDDMGILLRTITQEDIQLKRNVYRGTTEHGKQGTKWLFGLVDAQEVDDLDF